MKPNAPANPSRPYRTLPVNAAPRGSGRRRIATTPNSSAEAKANRMAAPQNGASSWLLNRTATPFTPPRTTIAMKARRVDRSGVQEIACEIAWEPGGRRTCAVWFRRAARTERPGRGACTGRARRRSDSWPKGRRSIGVRSGCRGVLRSKLGRRLANRREDRLIAGAATEVPGEGVSDGLIRWVRIGRQQGRSRDEHARRTEPALDAAGLQKGPLEGVKIARCAEALNGRDRAAGRLQREIRACVHGTPIDEDHAGAAL